MTTNALEAWLYPDRVETPSRTEKVAPSSAMGNPNASAYAAKALESEIEKLSLATEGTRNHTLNEAAFSLAQLVAAGALAERDTRDALASAARGAGLGEGEIQATINSAFRAGKQQPRVIPESTATARHSVTEVELTDLMADPELATVSTSVDQPASWWPIDLGPILSGDYEPETPSLFPREDGQHLIYPGRVHSFHGESESGKSLLAQVEASRLIQAGSDCLYVDFESDAPAVVSRLLELGAWPEHIREHFTYLRPDNDPRKFTHEQQALTAVLETRYALAVIDGVTDALGIFGASSKDNDEVAAFMRVVPRYIATHTGAAVILVDHVTKDAESRGRFAIGGQAKMNALDGSAFTIEVVEAIGRGMRGAISMRVAKDRPGGVRPHCGIFRKRDRTQEAAHVVIDSTTGTGISVTVATPDQNLEGGESGGGFKPTYYMEQVSRFLQNCPAPVSQTTICDGVRGKERFIKDALQALVEDGYVKRETGARSALMHTSIRPYSPSVEEVE